MDFKLAHILSDNWLHAIGVTLFHSLWIGVILSVITAIVMLLTRKLSANTRYQLLTFCLCLFVVAIGYAFYNEISRDSTTTVEQLALSQVSNPNVSTTAVSPSIISFSTKVNELMNLWNSYSAQIVLIWFLIICAKSIHLLLGLNTVYYLKRNKIFDAGRLWEEKLIELSNRLAIRQKIEIVQSGIAQVPMVIGHFKPLILIPLGLLNGLSITEVESILAHELAHIKRRDYLINLLQHFIEIIFFFNPAVLWLSKLIKIERENCCDDLALTCVADKKSYVKALLSCQEHQLNTPDYVMALTGKKNQLLNRVSRMLFNTKSTLNKMEKTVLTLTMVSIFLFSAAFRGAENQQNKPLKVQTIAQDTTKKKLKRVAPVKKTIVTSKNGKVTVVNGKLSAKEQAAYDAAELKYTEAEKKYKANEKELAKNELKYADAEKKYAQDRAKYESNNEQYVRNEANYTREAKRYQAARDQYDRDAKRYSSDSVKYERAAQRHREMSESIEPLAPISPAPLKPLKPALTTPAPLTPLKQRNPEPLKPTATITSPPAVPSVPTSSKRTKSTNETIKSISIVDGDGVDSDALSDAVNNEMLKDGIISNIKKLSYKLDKNQLLVNGVKQPADLHSKYLTKYLKKSSSALVYNFEMHTNK